MSTGTRSKTPEGALEHVLSVLSSDVYLLVFEEAGITTIYDLLTVDLADLKGLTPLDSESNLVQMTAVHLGKIKKLLAWYQNQEDASVSTWYTLTKENFNQFIAQYVNSTPTSSITTTSKPSSDMLQGVKRNITDYPRLREDKMWMSYNRNLRALAATHALSEVLNPEYVPTLEKEADFQAKNTFMYSVFTYPLTG